MLTHSSEDTLAQFHLALGRLCADFAHLETALGCAMAFLACPDNPRVGLVLAAEASYRARLASFSVLLPERMPAQYDETLLKEFISEAHRVEEERNRLIHSFYWSGAVGEKAVTRLKATAKVRKGLSIQLEDVKTEAVEAVAERACSLIVKLDALLGSAHDYPILLARFYALFRND